MSYEDFCELSYLLAKVWILSDRQERLHPQMVI